MTAVRLCLLQTAPERQDMPSAARIRAWTFKSYAGVWKYARYPNYGGEILQWWGLWLLSIAVLSGAYWICIISPLFLMGLLLFVSGVPLQEKQASLPSSAAKLSLMRRCSGRCGISSHIRKPSY